MATEQAITLAGVELTIAGESEPVEAWLSKPSIACAIGALKDWADSTRPPLKAARALIDVDVEDPGFRELIVELLVDADFDEAMALWDDLERPITLVRQSLPPEQRPDIDDFAVHVYWGEDTWYD